ncbi:TolC family protein [Sphingorhabdus sp.]|uniref:TolC family protein n=1 Tax=Sphingorhabdus sp. TaxID=1902408 RepID=UPI003D8127D9
MPQLRLLAPVLGGLVFSTLWAVPSPVVAAQVAADETVASDGAVTEVLTDESQPAWTFERLVSEVAARNPRIRSQSAAASAAGYDVAAARWQFFPAPAVQVESSGKDRQLIASVSQPIYSFGRLESDLKAAKSRASVANVRVEEAQYVLSFRVLDLFGQLLSASRSLDVFRQDLARLGALEGMIGRRVTAGVSAPVDLNLVLTRIRQSENNIVSLTARQNAALAGLSELLGAPLTMQDVVLPTMLAQTLSDDPSVAQDPVEQSLSYSPVLKRARGDVEVANVDSARARNAMKPTLYGKFEQRIDDGRYDTSAFPASRVLFGLQYSFGSGLSSLSRVDAARAQAEGAQLSLDAAREDIRASVRTDLETRDAASRLVESLRLNLMLQEETFGSYSRLFLAGKRSWLDVLNVVREVTENERALADAEVQYLVSSYRLQLQTGQIKW